MVNEKFFFLNNSSKKLENFSSGSNLFLIKRKNRFDPKFDIIEKKTSTIVPKNYSSIIFHTSFPKNAYKPTLRVVLGIFAPQ